MRRVVTGDKHLTFFEHLDDLRGRLVKSLLCAVAFSFLVYTRIDLILAFLIKPIGRVIFLSPAEAFITKITISLIGGFLIAIPFIFYQIWVFIAAGLTATERKYIFIFAPLSMILFFCGIIFGYKVILPTALKFFMGFSSDTLLPMITISKYTSFVATMTLSFGVVFQLPVLIIFLTKIGIVTPAFLIQKRRYAIVFIFIVSAILTPGPDYISQFLMAGPLIILYEMSVLFSWLLIKLSEPSGSFSRGGSP